MNTNETIGDISNVTDFGNMTSNAVCLNDTVSAYRATESFELFDKNVELESEYRIRKAEISASHLEYINENPELKMVLSDYLELLLHRKPHDIYQFTLDYYKGVAPTPPLN
ncbi:hypothetical protein BASA50_002070 [Batrachochytrium salamandrivorans]|uniref:RIIa domain-containing protein n=1 Tax=Batrachochytrium salamandrivorans TaxID=1357716 RepID=A0ABQ8FQ47_9FUNG|nr:hypothetical protein BASA62_006976 [Batrachochytrium salamandrivorans]KAH6580457.1 hypothetical protein BASA60_002854 [Batrachochytrium salamandrivorans]KAH6599517.1 hypothetical protein BASA61_002533 [Batrachochytrium salamandrivorans]KAH6600686.1 hypothetical protein BASA50_002070 [Batrachochytrium salamandrivorans]KAH9271658.1 hypothetical protein BASA83_006026 [Batrachochytrium salamandrivorans]